MIKRLIILVVVASFIFGATAQAGLTGHYYDLNQNHPDMDRWITGLETGYVESALTGATPTLAPGILGDKVLQWDWWNPSYYYGTRVDSDADLQSNFSSSWFPLYDGVNNESRYYFAVHWTGSFYVAAEQDYTYSMGSDDDSWLFIDDALVLDLGGVHGVTFADYTVHLTQGWHDIDIFFAERHVVQSGFQLNFFSDLEPKPAIPEPATMVLFGLGLVGGFAARRLRRK